MVQSSLNVSLIKRDDSSELPSRNFGSGERKLKEELNLKSSSLQAGKQSSIIVGNRIPRKFFVTSGVGESDITVHAGSYHLALKEAGIERYNIMVYSSIIPGVAVESSKPRKDDIIHGSVMETIMAVSSGETGMRLTAGIIFGWLYNKVTGKKYGGLVAEYSGHEAQEDAKKSLRSSLQELYENGFSGDYELKDVRLQTRCFVPIKKFGTAMVVIGFKDYIYPIISE